MPLGALVSVSSDDPMLGMGHAGRQLGEDGDSALHVRNPLVDL